MKSLKSFYFFGVLLIASMIIALSAFAQQNIKPLPKTLMICDQSFDKSDPETRAAFEFLKSASPDAGWITFKDLKKHPDLISGVSVVWFHRSDTASFSPAEKDRNVVYALLNFLRRGGAMLITGSAFRYIMTLGLEINPPRDSLKPCIDEGYGRKLGFHAMPDHPVFEGMFGGSYVFMPVKDTAVRITGYFGNSLPKTGKVIGVDWDYIYLRESTRLVIEYGLAAGKAIAVGGYMAFSSPNMNRKHLELFTLNTLRYLGGQPSPTASNYWDYSDNTLLSSGPPTIDLSSIKISPAKKWFLETDPLALESRYASNDFWDVASERILTMGTENGGIEEVWSHPFMAFRDYEEGIRFSYKDTIYWLRDERPEIEVRPEAFVREYKFPRGYLKEIIANDPMDPAGVIHYEYQGVYPAEFIIRFKSNLRLMWPYSENVTKVINKSWIDSLRAFYTGDKTGNLCLLLGADKKPSLVLQGQYDGFRLNDGTRNFEGIPTSKFQASFLLCYPFSETDQMDVIYSASSEGFNKTLECYKKALSDPFEIYRKSFTHISELYKNDLLVISPDDEFNRGYLWALLGTDRFIVNTPGMGRSIVAGYATTRKGWDGGQKVSGRPGYSWYFGRDGEWSGFALLDYGEFEKVREILEFYKKYQDISGKIFHEATTSGVIHYDAADATPLYIVLAGKYFRHTNDIDYLRNNWESIKKAIDFCFSTDTDDDHLIENTNVGHGWVEGGELYGSHATLYLNGIWASALEEAAGMAKALDKAEGDSYLLESRQLKDIINKDFWNNRSQFFSYGKNRDGSFRIEPTVLPAVPLYFHIADDEKADTILGQYAGNAFSTNWGTRIVRDDSPLFNPTGYHYGSVWPLFTGWTSLAEYGYGHYEQGYSHLMNNLKIYKYWAKGFAEEVLNGSRYLPSGVCSHQCWSETMVLQPVIEGLLGLYENLPLGKIRIAPHLPANWDSLAVYHIRYGNRMIGFKMKRDAEKYLYRFSLKGNGNVVIEFMPALPAGTLVTKLEANGKDIPFTTFKSGNYTTFLALLDLKDTLNLEIFYQDGISAVPVVQDPRPGSPSEGLRLISSKLKGKTNSIDLEGPAGSDGNLDIYLNGQGFTSPENNAVKKISGNIYRMKLNFEPENFQKYIRKRVVLELK